MIKVSDYLIKILKKAGVKVFFGVQGGAIAHLIESSSKAAEYIPVLNEQSAGLSAHGYYFANNKPSAVLTTTGPGYLNAIVFCMVAIGLVGIGMLFLFEDDSQKK